MEAVIAGWVAGFVMALGSTLALTYLAWLNRDSPAIERMVAREVNVGLVGIVIFNFVALGWTMAGLVAGSAYRLAGLDEGGWPGTGFYTVVVFVALAPVISLVLVWPRFWGLWAAMTALFVAAFGLLMPALASR